MTLSADLRAKGLNEKFGEVSVKVDELVRLFGDLHDFACEAGDDNLKVLLGQAIRVADTEVPGFLARFPGSTSPSTVAREQRFSATM